MHADRINQCKSSHVRFRAQHASFSHPHPRPSAFIGGCSLCASVVDEASLPAVVPSWCRTAQFPSIRRTADSGPFSYHPAPRTYLSAVALSSSKGEGGLPAVVYSSFVGLSSGLRRSRGSMERGEESPTAQTATTPMPLRDAEFRRGPRTERARHSGRRFGRFCLGGMLPAVPPPRARGILDVRRRVIYAPKRSFVLWVLPFVRGAFLKVTLVRGG
jgi:hypothetical protein